MKDEIHTQLRDQQAGFRKDRSCVDQMATDHHRTGEWMELFPLQQFRRLWKSIIRQCRQGYPSEASPTLWSTNIDCQTSFVTPTRGNLQSHSQRAALKSVQRENGSQTKLFTFAISFPTSDLLDMKSSTAQARNGIQWMHLDNLDLARPGSTIYLTGIDKCRRRPTVWQVLLPKLALISTKERPRSLRITQWMPSQFGWETSRLNRCMPSLICAV